MLPRFLRTESFRLTAIFVILLVGAMIGMAGLVYGTMHTGFRTELLLSADGDLASIRQAYATDGLSEAREVVDQLLGPAPRVQYLVLEDAHRTRIAGNFGSVPIVPGEQIITLPRKSARPHEPRQVIGRGEFIAPGLFAFAARDLSIADETEESVLHTLAWILLATVPLALGGGTLLSLSFLGRTDAMARACRRIMQGRLSDRIPSRGSQDALDQLATTINAMLDQIGALVSNVRQVSGDIAHDLRTPLTRLRGRLEMVRNEATTIGDYEQAVDRAIHDSDEILSIFTALLRIGQMESGSERPPLNDIDLSALLGQICEAYLPAAEDAGHILQAAIAPVIHIAGDRALLSQLFSNLIENSIRHTPRGTPITVGLSETDGKVSAFVRDRGPGIPLEERENIFRAFYRMERARSMPGSGLGLALVAAIVKYHGATLRIDDADPGTQIAVLFDEKV